MNKEKRIGRKLLCLIISLVMVCTLVPHVPGGLAYAEDNTQAAVDQTTAPAAEEAAPAETAPAEKAAPAETAPAAEPAEEQPLPLEAESEHFKATVTYGPEAGIPEGATLLLTEFDEGSDDFEAAKEALVADEEGNSVYSQASEEEQENMGMAAFDLTIYDAEGNVVEPTEEVAVNIEVLTLPDGADAETLASTMEIQHLNESTGDVVVEKVATVNSDEAAEVESVSEIAVDTEQETAVAEFTVDGFSTYTISWGNRSYGIHYVDTNGNSLTPTRTPEFSNGYKFLIYDVEGYEYDSTHYGSRTGTAIKPLLANYGNDRVYLDNNNNWQYLRNDIYVVYKAKPTPSQGGTPQVDQDEEWPEGNNAPQFSKSSTNNGNGTNTISLSIVGGEKPVEKSTPADVIVVFDVSGSMSESMNGQTRLARAKTAVNNMAYALLNGDNKGVRMALISFSTDAQTVPATGEVFTSDYNTFSGRVNNLGASGGTNWEKALKIANEMPVRDNAATFVVFVTDGDPTFRVSRGDVADSNLDLYTSSTYQYYRNNQVFGTGSSDNSGRNFDFAVDQVANIAGVNKNFYAIGISNDVTKVQNLTTEGGVDASHAFIASDSTAMENAFKAITESIKSSLGFGDVQITDGITSLTNAEMKVMQSVDPNSFKYYRYGGEGNKYGADAAHKTEWTTREADGCAAASYNETKGAVEWNMGETFQLEDDVTYVVEFTVWPSQAAYDLVADLNNGIKTYASLTDAEKAQVVEVTAPTETTTGTYALKTNTEEVNATYNKTNKTGDTVTISDKTDVTATYHEGDLQNMGLVSDFITIKKEWNNVLDGRSASAVKLTVTKDGSDYIKDIELSNDNEWTSGKEYISAGVITTAADGRYNVREKGHEYTVIEPDTTVSYYWNLTADVYRPMVIDGTLHVLIKTDAPTGKEGTDYFVIDDKNYQLKDGQTTLTASNDRRSYLNLKKAVTVAEGKTNPDPDAVFNYTVTIKDPAGADIWFSVMDKDKKTVEPAISENVTAEMDTDGKLTGYYHVPSGAEFTIGIKDGWNARFINLPLDTTYSIKETETAGFGLDSATATATNDGTAGTVNNDTVTGTVDKSNADYAVTYNNKITGAVAELEATKVLSGRDWTDTDAFQFVLTPGTNTAGDGVVTPMPAGSAEDGTKTVTVNKDTADKKALFGDILFPYEGTYNYTIKEVKPDPAIPGVVYDEAEHNVVVTVSKSGDNMTASVKYDGADSLTVTNTLTPVTVNPEVTKEFTGREWKEGEVFTFTIARASGEPETTPLPSEPTATAKKDDPATEDVNESIAVFGDMSFNAVGTYKYTITEQKGTLDGVAYDTTPIEVVVTVATNNNNELTKTVTYNGQTSATVENTFTPVSKALEVTKILNGREWEATDEFTFELAAVDNAPMPASDTAVAKKDDPATEENEQVAKFGAIEFTAAGTYNYTITEQKGSLDGVTYDATAKNVVVTVAKDSETNALSIESVKYNGENALNVENEFSPSGEVSLQVTKAITGREWKAGDEFTFTISKAANSPANTPMPENTTAKATTANHVAEFGSVEFTKAGTYTYNVVETKGSLDGITYDTTTHTITVEVTKNIETNALETAVTYDGKAGTGLTITNPFAATSAEIKASKKFENWDKADSFTFELTPVEGAPMPADAVNGKVSKTVTQTAPEAAFGKIAYEAAGDYKYTVTEVNGEVDGVSYDTTPHEVTVHVTKNETTNALTATVDYGTAGKLEIENTFSAVTTKNPIEVTKSFNDWGKAESFTFNLAAVTEGAPLPKGADGKDVTVATATKAAQTAQFGTITFEKAGTYEYTITESNDGVDGVSYDTTAHKVVITVTKAADATNALTVTSVKYDGEDSLTVKNTYSALVMPPENLLRVTKALSGRDWLDTDSFEFTLAGVAAEDGTMPPMPAKKTATAAKTTPTAVFDAMTFEKTGTYKYTITETNGKKGGLTYDTTPYEVTVVIGKDANNALKVDSVKYSEDKDSLTVTNTYAAKGTATFSAKKILKGRALKANEFTFELKNGETVVGTAANAEDGTVTFSGVEFVKNATRNDEGNYTFTISEVEPTEGKLSGVTYDKTVASIAVKVTDNGEGKLIVTYDGKDKAPTPEFTNVYTAEGYIVLDGLKTLEYGDLTKQSFDFVVLDKDGNKVATATAGGENAAVTGDPNTKAGTSHEFEFSAIRYAIKSGEDGEMIDETGEHTYTVKEVIPDEAVNVKTGKTYKEDPAADGIFELGNYRYDNSVKTIKVTVTDKGDGTLEVVKSTAAQDHDVEFTNTKAYTDIKITKSLDNYVVHEGVNEVTLAFQVTGKTADDKDFSAAGGLTFTKEEVESGTPKVLTIAKIPTDLKDIQVKEISGSNYKAEIPKVELKDGVYTVSINNTYNGNENPESGIINNYSKKDGKYVFSGKGEKKSGTDAQEGGQGDDQGGTNTEISPDDNEGN